MLPAKGRKAPERLLEGVLHHILGPGGIAGQVARKGIGAVEMGQDLRPEPLLQTLRVGSSGRSGALFPTKGEARPKEGRQAGHETLGLAQGMSRTSDMAVTSAAPDTR